LTLRQSGRGDPLRRSSIPHRLCARTQIEWDAYGLICTRRIRSADRPGGSADSARRRSSGEVHGRRAQPRPQSHDRLATHHRAREGLWRARDRGLPDGWELNAAGRQLLPIAEDIEAALGRIDAHASSALAGTIRLACPQAFALEYAVPALTSLQQRHPGLQVELITATQRVRQYRS